MSPEELMKKYKDAIVFVNTLRFAEEIENLLLQNGFPRDHILRMDNYLARELSEMYFDVPFFRLGEHEVLVDAGCYNMYTTYVFTKYCLHMDRAFAFEPDKDNYKKCLQNKKRYQLSQVQLIPKATWSERTILHFDARSNDDSRIDSEGSTSIETISIDEVVGGENVTFIKMDVEGAELESLKGACKTIRVYHPKLAICMYHKWEDMVELPLYIKSLSPEYRLYVRHMSNLPYGTVLYAV